MGNAGETIQQFASARRAMVEEQIRKRGITSQRVLDAMLNVPRHEFVPAEFLADAYAEEEVRGEKRVVLRLHPELAPLKVAVLPLLKKREEIVKTAHGIRDALARQWRVVYDDTAAIGRLYRRQDEVGTPYCVTVDVQTVGDSEKGETGDGKVTIRDRDSMEQARVSIDALPSVFHDLLSGGAWSQVAARCPPAK